MEGGEKLGRFDRGVSSYSIADVTIQIAFPEQECKCRWCRFLTHNDGLDRDKCFLTGDIIYSRETLGVNCPLVFINEVTEGDLKS